MSTIRASKIPVIEREHADDRLCHRCGLEWQDTRYKWLDRAPCRDCRDVLEAEGEDIALYAKDRYQDGIRRGAVRRAAMRARVEAEIAREEEAAA